MLSAVLIFAPLRAGDLPGYDDAHYAHIAKEALLSGHWWSLSSNGWPALEHPPLFIWVQAALFQWFGFSDTLARLPSALCGWLIVLLVFWLAQRILDERAAVLAMFVMAGTIYFLKYAARAMTDVPFTFLCLASLCACLLADENPRWYLLAGAAAGLAQITRGLMGIALPLCFAIDAVVNRRKPPLRFALATAALTFLPVTVWYGVQFQAHGSDFLPVHMAWLNREAFGELSPPWRRYTGAPEYAWMLVKSYWPWLPFMLVGIAAAFRERQPAASRALRLLLIWIAAVFVLCAAAKSRVLRYMLPAYPAFAVMASIGIQKLIPAPHIWKAMRLLAPVAALAVLAIGLFPPKIPHAAETRPMALAASAATPVGTRVAFYDQGQPRFDETNQLLWYGSRYLDILLTPEQLQAKLTEPGPRIFIVDRATYQSQFALQRPHQIIAQIGHLVCVRVSV
ncbi:MAG: glycosyltransferase family 39 protein [Acidobacteriia bacterium]|nr:glycosyltransferase family 39 protein [Terriglobia bacterium]